MNLNLFRVLFPRWDFFDRIGHRFDLEFKAEGNTQWIPFEFTQKRKPLDLFFNPEGNLAMAHVNIIEHFVIELQENPEKNPETFSTYKLLCALVIEKLSSYELNTNSIQFRVVARHHIETEVVFYSNLLKVPSL